MALALILGGGGVVLLLAGLVGGGFEFSGNVVPVVRSKAMRVACLAVGALLVVWAVGIVVLEQELQQPVPTPDADPRAGAQPTLVYETQVADTTPSAFQATVAVPPGYVADLYADPWTAADLYAAADASLENQAMVNLSCIVEGPLVQSPINQYSSTIWYFTSTGYFISDVAVFTGPTSADLPHC
jgi:hypothetical protein